jgi:hypothetical protein
MNRKYPTTYEQNKNTNPQYRKKTWATYTGKETKRITKLFKETPIKVGFRTQNTIQNIIKPYSQTDKYEKRDICQMTHLDCPLKYIGNPALC